MSRTLFDEPSDAAPAPGPGRVPLADRMRPRSLDEVVGQAGLVGEDGILRRALGERRLPSLILWGPPGSGKTTLARILAADSGLSFTPFSAVTSGIKEVKAVMADARRMFRAQGRATLLFVDEIHRFNRAQQDAFLPYVERGEIVLVGATTENPSFELNAALLSRCRVVVLDPLGIAELVAIGRRALDDSERGLGGLGVGARDEVLESIAQLASGDARRALSLLELAVEEAASQGEDEITGERIRRLVQRKELVYDKAGEEHFNLISALHKSLRESDPDAALYWLTRMLESGEDPLYLARRMVRFASEDVGLADPRALEQALAAWDAFHRLGSPEGELALAQAALYLAVAPKSNAVYRALGRARKAVHEHPAEPVPMAIRNAVTPLMEQVGYGKGHVYAPDTEEGVGGMECLPSALVGRRFYLPSGAGLEERIRRRLEKVGRLREQARRRHGDGEREE